MGIKSKFSALPKNTKNLLVVGVLLALVVALPLFIWGITTQRFLINQKASTGEPVACTLDAMICPDGSAVGRVPPNCDFAPCPAITSTPSATPVANSCGGTCGTNYDCSSGLICYNGFCRNPACTSVASCACPVATATPTSSPSPTRSFAILFKFDGVGDGSAAGAGVSVRFVNPAWGSKSYSTPPVITSYVGSGIYMARFSLPLLAVPFPVSDQYSIILKGEKHLGVKFCFASGQTTRCASGDTGQISIPDSSSLISLNFSGVPLPAGDTYTQDGVVNAVDFARINSLLSKAYSNQTDQDKRVGDLDYNGRVDARDMLLFRKTLETRYDEY